MGFTDYTKQNLVPYILGDKFPPQRMKKQLVTLVNEFGCRDVYQEGQPVNPKTKQPLSRTQYVENKLLAMTDENMVGLLTKIINESEQTEIILEHIRPLILEDGYNITENNGTYSIMGGIIDQTPPVTTQVRFHEIENQILSALDNAKVSIHVAVAWFNNTRLRDKLLEKQKKGVDVKIVIDDNKINREVDFTGLNVYRINGTRGGLMHNKFCVIDNQVIITGSYNWTNSAEYKHDECIDEIKNPAQASEYSVKFCELMNSTMQ